MFLYDIPRRWFRLSPPKPVEDRRRIKEVVSLVIDLVLAIVFGVLGMPVMVKWVGWAFCFIGFLYIVLNLFPPIDRVPPRTKILIGVLSLFIFVRVFWSIFHRQWWEERASMTSGEIVADEDGKVYSDDDVKFQIGARADGTLISWSGPKSSPIFTIVGSRLEIKRRNGKLLVSTEVREKQAGTLIVGITDNHWTVSNLQNVVFDKNYRKNALEVKDGRGRVVFQLVVLPSCVRFQGEWWHEDGNGGRIVRPFPYDPVKTGPVFVIMTPLYHTDEPHIEPMFKYPSKEHLGELADGFTLP